MKGLACFFSFIALFLQLYGQDTIRCKQSFTPLSDQDLKNNEAFELLIKNFSRLNKRVEASDYTIPVVVHVVYNKEIHNISDAQILSQIDVLNKDYNRTNSDTSITPAFFKSIAGSAGIKFKLALQDPFGLPTNGITRTFTETISFTDNDLVKYDSKGGKDAWDPNSYLNIWVCNMQGSTLGYYPADYVSTAGKPNDGVVITYRAFGTIGPISTTYNLGRTATHEVGHWFGLYHPWGPPANSSCGSDLVDDTPIQPADSKSCPKFPFVDSGTNCNNAPNGRNFSNFMDYTNDNCMNMFTKGQVNRMRSVLATNRTSIINSKGLEPLFNKDVAIALSIDTTNICEVERNVKVRIFNNGKDTVKAYSFSITANGITNQYTWKGKFLPSADTIWNLSELKVNTDGNGITANVSILPEIDNSPENNTHTTQFTCKNALGIYPNPVTETLYIKGNSPEIVSCVFYNLAGTEIFRTGKLPEINVSALAPGFYLVVLETNLKAVRQQLIIIR